MKQLDFDDDEGGELVFGAAKFNDLSYAFLHG